MAKGKRALWVLAWTSLNVETVGLVLFSRAKVSDLVFLAALCVYLLLNLLWMMLLLVCG